MILCNEPLMFTEMLMFLLGSLIGFAAGWCYGLYYKGDEK
jgi:hypothetical protein